MQDPPGMQVGQAEEQLGHEFLSAEEAIRQWSPTPNMFSERNAR